MKNVHIITGGNSGIGLACAKEFKEGLVLIVGRSEKKLEETVYMLRQEGIDAGYFQCDISKPVEIEALMNYAKDLGKIKTIVNCAGVSGQGVDLELTFNIDLVGADYLLDEALKVATKDMVVVMVASMRGHHTHPNLELDEVLLNPQREDAWQIVKNNIEEDEDVYNLCKRGILLLVQKRAKEFGEKGARIVSVSPGIIMTPMAEKAAKDYPEAIAYMLSITPAGRYGKPEDIAKAIKFLASDDASFITGTDLLIDGGMTYELFTKNNK